MNERGFCISYEMANGQVVSAVGRADREKFLIIAEQFGKCVSEKTDFAGRVTGFTMRFN